MKTNNFILNKYIGILLCSMLMLFACSKKDDPGQEPDRVEKAELVLAASATEITVAQAVTLEVTADGKDIDADIYINNNKIDGTNHTFEVTGTYSVIAKKEGYTDSKEVEITVMAEKKKVATASFSKVATRAYPTTFEADRSDRISIINEHIYVMERQNRKFRRYSLTADKWDDLASKNLLYSGVAGYLTKHTGYLTDRKGQSDKSVLVYLGGGYDELNIYYPPGYPHSGLKDSWTSESVLASDQHGERGVASDGDYIYFMGNARNEKYSRRIDRYVIAHDLWEEGIGVLPDNMGLYTQAVSTDKKLFIAGRNTERDPVFLVYDLQTQTTESKPVPMDIYSTGSTTSGNNTMVVYLDYLIYMLPNKQSKATSVNLYVYDLKTEEWLENNIEIKTDLFSNSDYNASLLLSSSGKIYAAGSKAGDFVLYEVDFKVTEQ